MYSSVLILTYRDNLVQNLTRSLSVFRDSRACYANEILKVTQPRSYVCVDDSASHGDIVSVPSHRIDWSYPIGWSMLGLILSYPIDFASLTSRHGQAVTDVSHSLALRWFSWREDGTFGSTGLGASTVSEQTLPHHTSPFILKGNRSQKQKTKQKTLQAQSIGMD